MYKLSRLKTTEFFSTLNSIGRLYVPADTGTGTKHVEYIKWSEDSGVDFCNNTDRSAKDFFFPQVENMMDFKCQGCSIEVSAADACSEKFIVFGVRACDVRSFDILDRVFLAEPVDAFYKARREKGIIISLCCSEAAETCFCTAFGINPAAPGGDISCAVSEEYLYFKTVSDKGSELFYELLRETGNRLLEECDDFVPGFKNSKAAEKLEKSGGALEKISKTDTKELFYSKIWEKLSEACLACGTCTYVCPACQCYDIKDKDAGSEIKRYRCWDSCMYSEFTRMAHGNPRVTQAERFRQRFMHKLKYYPENNEGIFACTGCGRCVSKCPSGINIVKVIKEIL